MLMLNEVSTAVATAAPAVWVVLNDSRYNMCAQGADILGLTNVDASLPETDFAAYAWALGASGIVVRRPDDLPGALRAALDRPGPVVVDVQVDPAIGAPTEGRNAGLLRDSANRRGATRRSWSRGRTNPGWPPLPPACALRLPPSPD